MVKVGISEDAMNPYRPRTITLVFLGLLTVGPPGFGQSLTLSEALTKSAAASARLQGLEILVKARQGGVAQADTALNPVLLLTSGNRENTLEVEQALEFPGKRSARVRAAQTEVEIAKIDLEAARLELESETAGLFIDVLWAERNVALLEDNIAAAEKGLAFARYRGDRGFGSPLDIIKGEVELARAKRLFQGARELWLISESRLKILLGVDPLAPLRLEGDIGSPLVAVPAPARGGEPPGDLPAFLAAAREAHPSIRRERMKQKSAEARIEIVRLSAKPDFALGLVGGIDDKEAKVGINLSFSLAAWDKKSGARLEALFEQKSAGFEAANAAMIVDDHVTRAFRTLQSAVAVSCLFEDGLLREAKDAAVAARLAYESGSFRFLDVVDAQRTYLEASLEHLESQRALRHAEFGLRTAVGKPLAGGGS